MTRNNNTGLLLEAGADLEVKELAGRTVVEMALKQGNVETAQALVDAGAPMPDK